MMTTATTRRWMVRVGVLAIVALAIWAFTPRATATAAPAGDHDLHQAEVPDAIMGRAGPPRGQDLAYYDGDANTKGYVSVPEGEGPFPAVILIHEWNGLDDRVRQMADALTDEGYIALAADLYSGELGTNRDENITLMRRAGGDQQTIIDNLDAAVSYLRNRSDVTGKIGTIGWCFGGGVAMSFALGGENHDATAIFYGALVTDPDELRALTHEVYGTFGALDRGPPPEQVNAFSQALRSIGVANDIHIYDDVDHGFWLRADRNPDLHTAPAADAWRRLKAYFERTLKSD